MSEWVGVIGTLSGAVVGAVGAYAAQAAKARADRREKLIALKRQTYVMWLAAVAELFDAIRVIYADHDPAALPSDARDKLRELSPTKCQVCLEEVRLIGSAPAIEAATALWTHLRANPVPLGQLGTPPHTSGSMYQWKRYYWRLRHTFTTTARAELSASAGVPVTPDEDEGTTGERDQP